MQMLTPHHFGCVVKNIERAIEAYRPLARDIGEIFHVQSQRVRVCFIGIGPGINIELVEPADEDSVVSRLLKGRVTFYHVGFLVPDFDAALQDLVGQGYLHMTTFQSEAFGMRRCAFLASRIAHLIEIIEQG